MATRDPVICTNAWTLLYDGTVDGAFKGCIQVTNDAVFRVMEGTDPPPNTPDGLTGIGSSPVPTPVRIGGTETLWARAVQAGGSIVAIMG